MPGTRFARRAVAALVVTRIVTGIRGIVVTPTAIVGYAGIADEVVAGQNATRKLRMLRDAGVEHGDRHSGASDFKVPRRGSVDSTDRIVQ